MAASSDEIAKCAPVWLRLSWIRKPATIPRAGSGVRRSCPRRHATAPSRKAVAASSGSRMAGRWRSRLQSGGGAGLRQRSRQQHRKRSLWDSIHGEVAWFLWWRRPALRPCRPQGWQSPDPSKVSKRAKMDRFVAVPFFAAGPLIRMARKHIKDQKASRLIELMAELTVERQSHHHRRGRPPAASAADRAVGRLWPPAGVEDAGASAHHDAAAPNSCLPAPARGWHACARQRLPPCWVVDDNPVEREWFVPCCPKS